MDLVHSELERIFDQDNMWIVARRETIVTDAAKGHAVELDLQLLHLPKQLNTGRLQLQLRMLGDITKDSLCSTAPEVASCLTKLHPQTRGLFKDVENLIKLSSHISGFIREMFLYSSAPGGMDVQHDDSEKNDLTVMHVYSNILLKLIHTCPDE